ncbi:MAG: hypothetical protein C0631_02695 [Sedimenticola sp.]|nr:MAG: hypothetical protein C0631_02695 [Sedimenticola sp.]
MNNQSTNPTRSSLPSGGQTTISPPAKVKLGKTETRPLASGIDSLNLAIDVHWSNTDFFTHLRTAKDQAKKLRADFSIEIPIDGDAEPCPFAVKPHGHDGYEWMLTNREMTLSVGNWQVPQSRPSLFVESRSEALWHLGAEKAIEKIKNLILANGGTKVEIKPSRVDLCVDALLPDPIWTPDLKVYASTRATNIGAYDTHRKLNGIAIGQGALLARLYDKPLEIRQKSKKFWMYDIWDIKDVPEGMKIIRIEFQLRREKIKELGINDISELLMHIDNIWGYCTQKWLRFEDNPGKHHTQRKTFDWWVAIQNGFLGIQQPEPLIRSKALNFDLDQNIAQALGHTCSIIATLQARLELDSEVPAEIEDGLQVLQRLVKRSEESVSEFAESVNKKRVKVYRSIDQHAIAQQKRQLYGFPKGK